MLKTLLIAAAALALTGAASAQQPSSVSAMQSAGFTCGERAALVSLLKQQFAEEQEEVRLQSEQSLLELFASEKGTWSILLSSPGGTSCVVAAGKGLTTLAHI